MSADDALQMMNQLLWNSLLVAGPVLAVALVVMGWTPPGGIDVPKWRC